MLLYPVTYIITVLPIASARFSAWAGHTVPFSVTIFCGTAYLLSGIVNVVVFTSTRRVLPPLPFFTRDRQNTSQTRLIVSTSSMIQAGHRPATGSENPSSKHSAGHDTDPFSSYRPPESRPSNLGVKTNLERGMSDSLGGEWSANSAVDAYGRPLSVASESAYSDARSHGGRLSRNEGRAVESAVASRSEHGPPQNRISSISTDSLYSGTHSYTPTVDEGQIALRRFSSGGSSSQNRRASQPAVDTRFRDSFDSLSALTAAPTPLIPTYRHKDRHSLLVRSPEDPNHPRLG
jgi:hypothetical protein